MLVLFGILGLGATQTHIHFTPAGPRAQVYSIESGLAEEDEVDFVILSSVKHDLISPTLKWAEQLLYS